MALPQITDSNLYVEITETIHTNFEFSARFVGLQEH